MINMYRIAIASDHAGYRYKTSIKDHLKKSGYQVQDFGTDSTDPVDYPDYIRPAAQSVASGENDLGIVLGGSGNGEAITANKIKGIRCALCWNSTSARLAKDDATTAKSLFEEKGLTVQYVLGT